MAYLALCVAAVAGLGKLITESSQQEISPRMVLLSGSLLFGSIVSAILAARLAARCLATRAIIMGLSSIAAFIAGATIIVMR